MNHVEYFVVVLLLIFVDFVLNNSIYLIKVYNNHKLLQMEIIHKFHLMVLEDNEPKKKVQKE